MSNILRNLKADLKQSNNAPLPMPPPSSVAAANLQDKAAHPPGLGPPPGFRLIPGLPPPQFLGQLLEASEQTEKTFRDANWTKIGGASMSQEAPVSAKANTVSLAEYPALPASSKIDDGNDSSWSSIKPGKAAGSSTYKNVSAANAPPAASKVVKKNSQQVNGPASTAAASAGVSSGKAAIPKKVRQDLLSVAFKSR